MRTWKLVAAVALLALVAQTGSSSNTIDLTPIVALFQSMLPLLLTIMLISAIFGLMIKLFDRLGNVWAVPLSAALVAQTSTSTPINVSEVGALMASILYALLPILVLVLVFSVLIKFFGKITDLFGRIAAAAVPLALVAQTQTPGLEQAQQVVQQITPLMVTLVTILMLISLPFIVFKGVTKGLQELLK